MEGEGRGRGREGRGGEGRGSGGKGQVRERRDEGEEMVRDGRLNDCLGMGMVCVRNEN